MPFIVPSTPEPSAAKACAAALCGVPAGRLLMRERACVLCAEELPRPPRSHEGDSVPCRSPVVVYGLAVDGAATDQDNRRLGVEGREREKTERGGRRSLERSDSVLSLASCASAKSGTRNGRQRERPSWDECGGEESARGRGEGDRSRAADRWTDSSRILHLAVCGDARHAHRLPRRGRGRRRHILG
jgi:hypothetical protein